MLKSLATSVLSTTHDAEELRRSGCSHGSQLCTSGDERGTWFSPAHAGRRIEWRATTAGQTHQQQQVCDILKSKHPEAAPLHEDAVLPGNPSPPPHPVCFKALMREVVQKASLHTFGSAGPSGVDAESWCHMCTSFGEASDRLCDAIALCSQQLATSYVNPSSLEAFLSCRPIPLDKKPGVRPIGIGEMLWQIIGKAILYVIGVDIHDAVGSLQLCAGHDNGIEAAIHAMREVLDDPATEAILLADSSNAFNRLNREVCLRNIQQLCPSLAAMIINTYWQPSKLFVMVRSSHPVRAPPRGTL